MIIPKGFFPQQDTGLMIGGMQADQSISFQAMQRKLTQMADIVQQRPGGRQTRSASPARAAAAPPARPTPGQSSCR